MMSAMAPLLVAQLGLAAASQLQQFGQINAQEKAAKQAAQQQADQVRLAADIETRRRKDLLERASATARARFGARGLGDDGSAGAVLGGLLADSERDGADRASLVNARLASIDRGLGGNLLDLAQERDRRTISALRGWAGQFGSLT